MNPAKQLIEAGFDVSVTDSGKLAVTPASKLTPELRTFIANHKPEIVAALTAPAANDARLTEAPPAAPPDRLELFRLANERYFLHVLECSVCSAGGRGYGSRCAVGQPLWDAAQKTPMPWPWGD